MEPYETFWNILEHLKKINFKLWNTGTLLPSPCESTDCRRLGTLAGGGGTWNSFPARVGLPRIELCPISIIWTGPYGTVAPVTEGSWPNRFWNTRNDPFGTHFSCPGTYTWAPTGEHAPEIDGRPKCSRPFWNVHTSLLRCRPLWTTTAQQFHNFQSSGTAK